MDMYIAFLRRLESTRLRLHNTLNLILATKEREGLEPWMQSDGVAAVDYS